MECLHPIYLVQDCTHIDLHDWRSKRLVKVPCGKCINCLKNKQNKLVVRIVTEAQNYNSMHFLTLTYNDENLPISSTFYLQDGDISVQLERSRLLEDSPFLDEIRKKIATIPASNSPRYFDFRLDQFRGAYGENTEFYLRLTPSLKRLDFRLWLKNCRVAYKRQFGVELPKFKYLFCGEYGSRSTRPHYHCLLLGLSSAQVHWMSERWKFGFTYWKRCNTDTKDKYAVARYVSKYMTKGSLDCESVRSGHAEKPRYALSRHFGDTYLPVDHFLCYDIFGKYDPNSLKLEKGDYLSDHQINVITEEIAKRMSVVVPGCKCRMPIPENWKKLIYYDKEIYADGKKVRYKPKRICKIMQEIALDKDLADSQREFEQFKASQPVGTSLSTLVVLYNRSKEISRKSAQSAGEKTLRRFYSQDAF